MKLKNIVGALVSTAAVFMLSTAVFAAPTVKVGNPVDLENFKEIKDLTVDDIVAIPIDIITDSESDVVKDFNFAVKYDTDVLIPDGSLTKKKAGAIGDIPTNGAGVSGNHAVFVFDEDGVSDYSGAYSENTEKGWVGLLAGGVNMKASDFSNGSTVAYIFFKVKAPNTKLNTPLASLSPDAECYISVNEDSNIKFDPTFDNNNVCAGAFNIKIDSTELKQFVHGVSIKVDGGAEVALDACKEDGTTYILPVRLTSATKTSGTANVQVILKVADTDTEGATTTDLVVPTPISVTLGAPTSYTDSAVTTE